jgi:hypothetical protein
MARKFSPRKQNPSARYGSDLCRSTQRWLAFVISAGLSGLAGSLKTLVLGFATLSDVH